MDTRKMLIIAAIGLTVAIIIYYIIKKKKEKNVATVKPESLTK